MTEFFNLFILIVISMLLSVVILFLSYTLAYKNEDPEKLSAYECGFDPFDDARSTFDIRFYLVAILFIVFDLEVTFLFPWVITLRHVMYIGTISMFIFLSILTVGFVYEWRKGGLEWN